MITPDPRGDQTAPAIDLAHLAEQTAGDADLQAELLALFVRQARDILRRLEAAGADAVAGDRLILVHTLGGAARALGAWEVAAEAQRLEEEARAGAPPSRPHALRRSVERACDTVAAIGAMPAGGLTPPR